MTSSHKVYLRLLLLVVGLFAGASLPSGPSVIISFRAAALPNDPFLLDEFQSYAPQLLNLFAAWDFALSDTPIVIAVLDSGIAPNHPEFAGRLLDGYDFINDDNDPADDHGHGTHVAGIVAAAIDNGEGITGVCGICQIMPVKVLNEAREGSPASIAAGIRYAVDHGAQIIVLSLGYSIGSQTVLDAVNYAQSQDVLLVAAAGNDGVDIPFYPAAYPNVLAVTATDRFDRKLALGNFGEFIDVAAPGDNIYSTYHQLNTTHGFYAYMSGTSMAAPFVAGLAGLLLAQAPERSAADLSRLITNTAVDLGAPGWDPIYGHGRIDPVAALQAEVPTPATLVGLSGKVWHDLQQTGPEQSRGFANVEIALRSQNRLVGLTHSSGDGTWQWFASTPATYTISVRLAITMVATSTTQQSVLITSTAPVNNLDFWIAPLPTATDLERIISERQGTQVQLAWTATPLVRTIQIERATQIDGEYRRVGTVRVNNLTAASVRVDFTDILSNELRSETLFYRVLLEPGNAIAEPVAVPPEDTQSQIFLPLVAS